MIYCFIYKFFSHSCLDPSLNWQWVWSLRWVVFSFGQHKKWTLLCSGLVTGGNLGPLACRAAKAICWHQFVGKESTAFICRAPCKENGQLMLKRPELPNGFQGRAFKATFGVKVRGGMNFFWLVGGEVIRWCSGDLNHQPSGSNQSGVHVLVVTILHLGGVLVSAEQLRDMCQIITYIPGGGTRSLFYPWTIVSWLLFLHFCIPSLS